MCVYIACWSISGFWASPASEMIPCRCFNGLAELGLGGQRSGQVAEERSGFEAGPLVAPSPGRPFCRWGPGQPYSGLEDCSQTGCWGRRGETAGSFTAEPLWRATRWLSMQIFYDILIFLWGLTVFLPTDTGAFTSQELEILRYFWHIRKTNKVGMTSSPLSDFPRPHMRWSIKASYLKSESVMLPSVSHFVRGFRQPAMFDWVIPSGYLTPL